VQENLHNLKNFTAKVLRELLNLQNRSMKLFEMANKVFSFEIFILTQTDLNRFLKLKKKSDALVWRVNTFILNFFTFLLIVLHTKEFKIAFKILNL
jgi:hypothetical protein